jgi:amidase
MRRSLLVRRLLVGASFILCATAMTPAPAAFPFEEATIADLQARMKAGTLTARALTEAYLARITAIDPQLSSVLEVNPDALAIADALDAERKAKGPRGPMHGIPVLIKDNIATADKMQTTAGSLALVGAKPPKDAFIVERLRASGAIILGKTNLSEWANMRSTHSSSGWSGRGGQVHNPYALDRSPCGSSSGTGASIGANLAVVGVGTETDGSIVCPSAAQALVGIKPTVGLLSRSGIIPISHTQDTPGPMTRTVADAAALLTAMAGVDPGDPATAAFKGAPVDYTTFLTSGGLKGVRIGIVRSRRFGGSPTVEPVMASAIAALRAAGAVIVDSVTIPHLGEYDEAENEVLLTELQADMNAYLRTWAPGAPMKTLADLAAYNRAHADREMPWFGQEQFDAALTKGPLTAPKYLKALALCRRLARDQGLDAAFAAAKVDALIAPTGGPAWTIDQVTGDHFVMSSSSPAAVAGYPAITVPAGFTHGLPIGITFMGRAWSEGRLITLAYGFEQATRARKPPTLQPTVAMH